MALLNPVTGEYLKVTGFQADFPHGNLNAVYLLFANADQRQRYESGLSPYEVFQNGQFNSFGHLNDALEMNPDNNKSTGDAILTACYIAMKNDMFNSWIDA